MAEYKLSKAFKDSSSTVYAQNSIPAGSAPTLDRPAAEAFRIAARKRTPEDTAGNSPVPASAKPNALTANKVKPISTTVGSDSELKTINNADLLNFNITSSDLFKSLILSEVLGRPRSMRKARW